MKLGKIVGIKIKYKLVDSHVLAGMKTGRRNEKEVC